MRHKIFSFRLTERVSSFFAVPKPTFKILSVGFALFLVFLLNIPAAAQNRKEVRVAFNETTLENGLRVVTIEDRSAPVVAIAVTYNVGSRDERKGHTGFAHLFEHMMFQGSE